jgi:hypothetical protein
MRPSHIRVNFYDSEGNLLPNGAEAQRPSRAEMLPDARAHEDAKAKEVFAQIIDICLAMHQRISALEAQRGWR